MERRGFFRVRVELKHSSLIVYQMPLGDIGCGPTFGCGPTCAAGFSCPPFADAMDAGTSGFSCPPCADAMDVDDIHSFDLLPLKEGRTRTGMHVWHGRGAGLTSHVTSMAWDS